MADSNSGFSHFSKHKMYEIQKIRHSIHPLGSTDGDNRVVCIDRLEFDENGLILPVKMS